MTKGHKRVMKGGGGGGVSIGKQTNPWFWFGALGFLIGIIAIGFAWKSLGTQGTQGNQGTSEKIIIVRERDRHDNNQVTVRPGLFPEPITRLNQIGYGGLPTVSVRGGSATPIYQVGILTAEGGSSSSASPDRTILPLFGRELDPRRSKWNYYTRTDGTNPVQVPVRVGNRVCDDDTNGCNEVYDDDSVHVPALGRSFKATVYRRSLF